MFRAVVQSLLHNSKDTQRYVFWQIRGKAVLPKVDLGIPSGGNFLTQTSDRGSQSEVIQF